MEEKMKNKIFSKYNKCITVFIFLLLLTLTIFLFSINNDFSKIIVEKENLIQKLLAEKNEYKKLGISTPIEEKVPAILKAINPTLDPSVVSAISDAILQNSKDFKVSPLFILALIDVESWGVTPRVLSSINAVGLMQINLKVHQNLLKEYNISEDEAFHFYWNIKLGCRIYTDAFKKTRSISGSLSKYVGAVESDPSKYIHKVFKKWDQYERWG